MRRMRPCRGTAAAAAVLLALTCPALSQPAAGEGGLRLPYATAPDGQWGADLSAEYQQRTIDHDDVAVRRLLFRLGAAPAAGVTVWAEGGVASLELIDGDRSVQGDFGTAVGLGATLAPAWFEVARFRPFISGRATMFISRLSDRREVFSGVVQTRRSRFELQEGTAVFGLTGRFASGAVFGGAALRSLLQKEKRSTRSNNNPARETFDYNSGIEPGLSGGYIFNLPARFQGWFSAELFPNSARLTVSLGQWGSPL